jgi:hypothetical protein|tara:strand:+ start:23 stop:532 length:510 start_codon:yes stop_codon:yes gene_type:complete
MALEQELPGIEQNELFDRAFDWEPKYSNRFIMYISDIPTYIIKAAARPSLTNGEVLLDHINVERKLKGKTRWQDVSITLYDPIVPSGAQAVMEWVRLHHESLTGRDGYSTQYKKDIRFNSLSPTGEIIEEWLLKGAFIADSNFGQMDWGTEESVQIELTLKYDYAVLEF